MQDFCQVVGAEHALIPHERAFLRNVSDEEVGDIGECDARLQSEGFILRSDVCVDIVDVLQEQSGSAGAVHSSWVMTTLSAMAFFAVMAML